MLVMKKFNNVSLALIIPLLMFASCSKVEKEIETFQKTTDRLDKTTTGVSYTAESIKEIANSIFPQMRSGDTIRVRNEEWDILTDKEKGLGEKMVAAGIFFQALEYQFWTANNMDNKSVLELMFRDAADEFQGRMYDLYRKVNIKGMSPVKEGKRHSDELAFYALAFTMDRSHHYQSETAKKYPDLKFVTFQDIIRNALTKEKKSLPVEKHEAILLSGINKEIITELYKARVDMLATLALRDLVDQRNMTIGNYSRAGVFMVTGGRFGSMDVPETLQESNIYTKQNVIQYLKASLEAKEFLNSIEIKHKMEKTLRSAFLAIDFDEVDNKNDTHVQEIRSLVQKLI